MDNIAAGMLVGMHYGSSLNSRDYANQIAKLRQAINDAEIQYLSQQAQKEAAKDCIGAIVAELCLAAAKEPFERRHSDPEANSARGEDFIDTAEAHLIRLSSGRLSFSSDSVSRIKESRADVKKIVKAGGPLEPEANRNASPLR